MLISRVSRISKKATIITHKNPFTIIIDPTTFLEKTRSSLPLIGLPCHYRHYQSVE